MEAIERVSEMVKCGKKTFDNLSLIECTVQKNAFYKTLSMK